MPKKHAKVVNRATTVKDDVYLFLIFFPVAHYQRVGEITLVTVFGIPVYKKVGGRRAFWPFLIVIDEDEVS